MKNLIYLFAAVTMFVFTACGGGETTTEDVAPEDVVAKDVIAKAVAPSDTVAVEEVVEEFKTID